MEALIFTLYAPLSSWGDEAIGEVRSSWDRPSRSAILGLVAAALGLTRDDAEAHARLDIMLGLAVRVALSGAEFIDYHTAQDPTDVAVRKFRPRTRKAALECADLTSLSPRSLRQDALYVIALWQREPADWTLDSIAKSLREPVFPLYAGRKANALGLPLHPVVGMFESLAAALGTMPPLPAELLRLQPKSGWGREVSYDRCSASIAGFAEEGRRSIRRRDAQPHRQRWQFAERIVDVSLLPGSVVT